MNRTLVVGALALLTAPAAAVVAPAFAEAPKISNARSAPDPGLFLRASFEKPTPGVCEVVSSDPNYVKEMLVRFGEGGAKFYERRVALVIGNEDYRTIGKLRNPANDAASMARMFRALGFTVYRSIDATTAGLNDCFVRFKADLESKPADIALFFYAGHGVQLTSQVDGEKRNYMLSVDAAVDADGKASGFKQVDAVLNEMRAHSKQAVFLYDACRNSPLAEGSVKEADGEAVRQFSFAGAAAINAEESEAASAAGLFIAYATSPNKTADDAWGPAGSEHSPFTEALLKSLPMPGVVIEEALAGAFNTVGELTQWKQTPWTNSSLTTRLRLNGDTRKAELQTKSSDHAANAVAARARGIKWAAIMSALKGQPPIWSKDSRASAFAAARAELYRAADMRDFVYAGHDGYVSAVAFSPDKDRVATAGGRTIEIWDASTGVTLSVLEASKGGLSSVAFSPSGDRIVAGAANGAELWDTGTGELLRTFEGHTGQVDHVAFSRDGAHIATGSRDSTAKIWDANTGALLRTLQGHAYGVGGVAFSHDGARVVTTSSDSSAKIWDVQTGELVKTLEFKGRLFTDVAFSPDGAHFATGTTEVATIWDARTGALLKTLEGHTHVIHSVAFSADGARLVTASSDRTAKVWDTKTGALLNTLQGHRDLVSDAEFDFSGERVATSSADGTARLWDVGSHTLFIRNATGNSIAFSPDGKRLATTAHDYSARLWDAHSGADMGRLAGHNSSVSDVAFNHDGTRVVTASIDSTAKVWDSATAALLLTLTDPSGAISSVAVSRDHVATSSDDIKLWHPITGALVKTLPRQRQTIWGMAFSSNGDRLATASSDGTAKIWDVASGGLIFTLEGHSRALQEVAFSPDGRLIATVSIDKTARVWDARTGSALRVLEGHGAGVVGVDFSPDNSNLVTASHDGTARTWDSETGALLNAQAVSSALYDVAFSPDGERVAAASYEGAQVYEVGLYGPDLLEAAYDLLTDDLRAEVERERIRYWEVDPALLQ